MKECKIATRLQMAHSKRLGGIKYGEAGERKKNYEIESFECVRPFWKVVMVIRILCMCMYVGVNSCMVELKSNMAMVVVDRVDMNNFAWSRNQKTNHEFIKSLSFA